MKNKILIAVLAAVILITLAGCGQMQTAQCEKSKTADTSSASVTSDTETSDDAAAESSSSAVDSEITTEKETTVPTPESTAKVSTQNTAQPSVSAKQDTQNKESASPKSTETWSKSTQTVTEKPVSATASSDETTIYGSIAQSESENISANVKWGKAQSAKEGNVPFQYKRFLGYRKGADGKPEIDPEQAETVKRIYERFLAGDSLAKIADDLNADGVTTPSGKGSWLRGTIQSILTNEKYKGDAVLNKTYISDCLTKKVKINNGERPKYYVENNHPAIIDSATFGRVQEEMARRSGKHKVKQVGTKTEQGKYSGKYALTELLICGECGTPYRRCTWTAKGKKKIVWRCINRLDYGKKYCRNSPSIEESVLQNAIMTAIIDTAKQNADVLKTLKLHIGMGLNQNDTEDKSLDIQIRIAEIDAEFHKMLTAISSDTVENFDEAKATELMNEKSRLEQQLAQYADAQQKRENAKSRLDEIYTILDGLKNHPLTYDDQIIRQILECAVVESKEKIKVVFVGGLEVEQEL